MNRIERLQELGIQYPTDPLGTQMQYIVLMGFPKDLDLQLMSAPQVTELLVHLSTGPGAEVRQGQTIALIPIPSYMTTIL